MGRVIMAMASVDCRRKLRASMAMDGMSVFFVC